jgi:hypothetical protein
MFGGLWDTAFQAAASPIYWAVEKGKEDAGCIKNQMEARSAFAGTAKDETSDNLEVLADWVTSWRRNVYRLGSLAGTISSSGQEEALAEAREMRPSTVERRSRVIH